MRIQIFSDAHIDFAGARGLPPPAPDVQLVVVAGDTCEGLVQGLTRLRQAFPAPLELVVVAGNHEFHGRVWAEEIATGRRTATELGISFLENDSITVGRLRIVGATLWTDYTLFGEVLRVGAMQEARRVMRDHRRIKWQKQPWLRFRPEEARLLHFRTMDFISHKLATFHDGPTLMLTHHAPCLEAVSPASRDDLIAPAYASNLLSFIDRFQPDYWISGHTHMSLDLLRGQTRLISNPIGYACENKEFDPQFTVEIER